MTEPVDQATRVLVSRDGLAQTLFVEAGAGTGKTTQLVDRIANLVLENGVRLSAIAAITFTEAAAAELQARVRVQFEQRLAAAVDEEVRRRCREAIADADLASITTLHGFASRLLGEFAIDAGIPPRVRVLDDVSSQLAFEDRWNRFVDALYDDPANEAVLVRAALVDVAFEPQYQGHVTMKDVAVELDDNWDRLVDIAAAAPDPIGPVDFSAYDDAVQAVVDVRATCTDPDDLLCRRLDEFILPEMLACRDIADPDRKLRSIVAQKHETGDKAWTTGRGGKAAAWGGDASVAKELVKAVRAAIEAVVAGAADEVLRHLLALVSREVLASAAARREDGGLEFHDLLVLARDLLRTKPEARRRLHERYSQILLDEFQDTDPIQIELAVLIAASIGDPGTGGGTGGTASLPTSWDQLVVEPGRLFFVGDPKQSIYRFRRADIRLFLQARDRFGPDGSWQRLVTNFRTVSPIVDWVNAFFGATMADELPGKQPRYEPLSASRQPRAGTDHRPVLLGGCHPDPKVRAPELRAAEAADVAAVVADVRAHPAGWPVYDRSAETWRDATLADVTVLVPTRTSLPFLRTAFEAAGIPYRLATGTLVYETQEVRDALAAMRAVDDPSDELSLVASLRSPLYGCSDVDLFTFRHAGGRWDLRAAVPEAVPHDHPVRLGLAHLGSLWEERWWLSPSALLERLLRDRRAFVLGFGDPRPAEVWRRLRFLVDQARAFEEARGGDLRAFLDWAALQGSDSAKVHEPLLAETDDDSVRILTIHGAKGLEFPITILSGLTTQPGKGRNGVSLVWTAAGQPEVRLRRGIETASHDPWADLELEMDVHEKRRLLYVATTRARDHLVVSCHHKERAVDTYAGWLWQYFADQEDLWRRFTPRGPAVPAAGGQTAPTEPVAAAGDAASAPVAGRAPVEPTEPVEPVGERERWLAAREALLAPQRASRAMSATAVARSAVAADAALAVGIADDDDDGADRTDDSAVPVRRQGRAGSAVGRAVHATLQVIDLADPRTVDAQVRRQCDIESIPDLVPVVAALVRSALASDTVRLAVASPHHREIYVAAPVGDRMVEGYVDLLIESPAGLVVVDYKTDAAASEAGIDAKLAAYELQGASYAVALEAVTGLAVVDCRFVFCRAGGAIERSVTDLPAAKQRVRAVLGADAR